MKYSAKNPRRESLTYTLEILRVKLTDYIIFGLGRDVMVAVAVLTERRMADRGWDPKCSARQKLNKYVRNSKPSIRFIFESIKIWGNEDFRVFVFGNSKVASIVWGVVIKIFICLMIILLWNLCIGLIPFFKMLIYSIEKI